MKILVLADQKSKYLYDFYEPDKLKDVDLIISCGDLSPVYLSFFVTLCNVPLLYVRGNHDDRYEVTPPEGCICIEDDIFVYEGIRILGLGGSMEYIPKRVRKLKYKLWKHKGFDILVTHAPAYQINDLEDLPHRGFAVFRTLMEKYEPKYFFHGHVHANYSRKFKRKDTFGKTTIVNGFEYCIVEYPPSEETGS